ncbi:type II secretion system protein [Candidatus Kaiserbacteria bacterium]|nr:type II secretion system protein [Candidatus Kaiserbacteria bacterium]
MKFSLPKKTEARGFTLIEILVVIGIIAVLAAVVLIAINPARQFAQANDSQRTSNLNAILNAVGQYMADHQGTIPANIAAGDTSDTDNFEVIGDGAGEADICADLVPTYMPALPVDPTAGDDAPVDDCAATYDTGYQILQDSTTGRISVLADGQIEAEIIVTR